MTRALIIATLIALAAPASATPARDRDVIQNARACVGEVGWIDLDACTAIVYVHSRRAQRAGVSVGRMAELYSAALRHPQRMRPWVSQLADTPQEPAGWPSERADWPRYRAQWRVIVAHVEAVLRGNIEDPCADSQPDHYGSLHLDGPRAERAGWTRVCEDVHERQAFWRSR